MRSLCRQPLYRFALVTWASLLLCLGLPANAQTLDRVQDSATLRIGFRTDDRPFSYLDDTGHAAGYAVTLCRKIAEEVKSELRLDKLTVEEVPVTAKEHLLAIQNEKIDLLCGAIPESIARRRVVSFSIPIFLGGFGVLTRVDAPSSLRALLAGEEPEFRPRWRATYGQILQQRTATVLAGTAVEEWVNERIHEFGIIAKVVPTDNYQGGIDAVLKGSSDMLFGDRAILLDAAKRNAASSELLVISRYFSNEVIALALSRGDEDFRLLVDRTLSRLYRSGEIDDIYTVSFGDVDPLARRLFNRAALPE